MAGNWIKFRPSLIGDGRVRIVSTLIADKYPQSVTLVIGGLVRLWSLADEYADESGLLYGYTADAVNTEIGIENFCQSLPGDWIDLTGEWIKLPEYQQHNGTTAKRRATEQRRKQKTRKSSASNTDIVRTREEKNRKEDIYNSLSTFEPTQESIDFLKLHKLQLPTAKNIAMFIAHHQEKHTSFIDEKSIQAAFRKWMAREKKHYPGGGSGKKSAAQVHADANTAGFE